MNPNLNAVLTAVRALLMVIGGIMAKEGLEHTTAYSYVMIASGSIMVIGPAIWGVISSIVNWRKASAVGVAAGINMTVQGKAITDEGHPISAFSPDAATPPKPVTIASAQEIVANFAPPASAIAKS